MQPDIQEDAIAPSAGQPAVAPSWSSETSRVNLSAGLYSKFYVFSTAEIANMDLIRGRRECRPKDMLDKHEDTHAAKLQSNNTQASPAAAAGQQVSCEKLLAAQEQLKTWLLLSSVMDEGAMLVLALTEKQQNLLGSR